MVFCCYCFLSSLHCSCCHYIVVAVVTLKHKLLRWNKVATLPISCEHAVHNPPKKGRKNPTPIPPLLPIIPSRYYSLHLLYLSPYSMLLDSPIPQSTSVGLFRSSLSASRKRLQASLVGLRDEKRSWLDHGPLQ